MCIILHNTSACYVKESLSKEKDFNIRMGKDTTTATFLPNTKNCNREQQTAWDKIGDTIQSFTMGKPTA